MTRSDPRSYDYLDRFADIAGAIGRAETAARLYGAADAQRERAAQPIEPAFRAEHEARIDVARRVLGDEAFAAAYAAGRALTQRQAEAEALSVTIQTASPTVSLSPRELDVLRLLAAGRSDRAIAEALFIGERTVNTHVGRVFAKLGVRNRAAAVAAAVAAGLIDPTAGGANLA
jgi:DNA-binding CsgD family transcriptional regulator